MLDTGPHHQQAPARNRNRIHLSTGVYAHRAADGGRGGGRRG